MSPTPRWISISAASALGLGIIATGAVGVANAMPLVNSTTTATVPPISTVPGHSFGDAKGSAGTGVASVSDPSPPPGAVALDPSSPTPTAPGTTTPAAPNTGVQVSPLPQPPAPVQPTSPDSVSVATPVSVDSVD